MKKKLQCKIVALIPLRGGSKSIPNKNVRDIYGKPLCWWVINSAIKALGKKNVYVSTDSEYIKSIVSVYGVNVIDRPYEFATDEATTESVMLHFAEQVKFDVLLTIQATSPLTTCKDILNAIKIFKNKKYDSMLTGIKTNRFIWSRDFKPLNYNPNKRPRRQDNEYSIVENGAFYITKREILNEFKCRVGGNIGIYLMSEDTLTEIDEENDWDKVEKLLVKKDIWVQLIEHLDDTQLIMLALTSIVDEHGLKNELLKRGKEIRVNIPREEYDRLGKRGLIKGYESYCRGRV